MGKAGTQKKRRALGQHFLISSKIITALCQKLGTLLQETRCQTLLEIGPGKGALTTPVLEMLLDPQLREQLKHLKRFVIVERDKELFKKWANLSHQGFLTTEAFCGDFVQLESSIWDALPPVGVVSNLPYSSSIAILNRLAPHTKTVVFMLLTFQLEVAQRLCAPPEARKRGSLSVWIQNLWDVSSFLTINPGAFRPPPKVRSQAVLFMPRLQPRVPGTIQYGFAWESLLKNSFAQPRKMLRALCAISPSLQNALEHSGVDGTKRASALSWEEWNQLFQALLQATEKDAWDL